MRETPRILLVEDDEDDVLLIRETLEGEEFVWEGGYKAGLSRYLDEQDGPGGGFDVVITDQFLGDGLGTELIQKMVEVDPDLVTILLTGKGTIQLDQDAFQSGATDYLEKEMLDTGILPRMIRYARRNREVEQLLRRSAVHDPLTGLPNRLKLTEHLGAAVVERQNGRHQPLCVMFLDLDRFKLVNDLYGHAAGDVVLAECAARLRDVLRTGDFIARIGGDEFVVVLNYDSTEAWQVAVRLQQAISPPISIDGTGSEVSLSISIGLTESHPDCETPEQLIQCADKAMYEAKCDQETGIHIYGADRESRQRVARMVRLKRDFHNALSEGQLSLYHQPIVELASSRITGFETQLCWHHPTEGVLMAEELATTLPGERKFLEALEAWVVDEVAEMVRRATGDRVLAIAEAFPNFWINIPRLFTRRSSLDPLLRVQEESAFPPGAICIELNSSIARHIKEEGLQAEWSQIPAEMVVLAVDSVDGSSLWELLHLPFSQIKLSAQLMGGVERARSDALIAAVVEFSTRMRLPLTMGGIDSREHLEQLIKLGVAQGQGEFLYPMMEGDAVLQLLRQGVSDEQGGEAIG